MVKIVLVICLLQDLFMSYIEWIFFFPHIFKCKQFYFSELYFNDIYSHVAKNVKAVASMSFKSYLIRVCVCVYIYIYIYIHTHKYTYQIGLEWLKNTGWNKKEKCWLFLQMFIFLFILFTGNYFLYCSAIALKYMLYKQFK